MARLSVSGDSPPSAARYMADCTVVIPCFNEAQRLDSRAFVDHAVRGDCSLLFVNDGSSDETGALLDELCEVNPARLSVLHLARNGGKAEAVRQGVLRAMESRPAFFGYWDADLATPLDTIDTFRDYLVEHPQVELLLGARVRLLGRAVERRFSRHYAGRCFALAASAALRLSVYDTQCGAKLFRNNDRTRTLFASPFRTRWLFDVELLARFVSAAAAAGQSAAEHIHELPLQQWRDVAGSKLRARDFINAAIQLADIAWHYRLAATNRAPIALPVASPLPLPKSTASSPAAATRTSTSEPVA